MVILIALRIVDRIKESGHTQEVLSKHAGIIKSRLGFHELNEDRCSREGYIILYMRDDRAGVKSLMDDLAGIYGIEVRQLDMGALNEKCEVPDTSSLAIACLLIRNKSEIISDVQSTLTSFGCTIRTRLGINEVIDGEDSGLIMLELVGDNSEMNRLINRLQRINNLGLGIISFS